jgi:toxin YoeB
MDEPGPGEPERLPGDLSGFWSCRINHEHRLVHHVKDEQLVIVAARYHD